MFHMIGLFWTPDPNLVFSLGIEMSYTKQFSVALPETIGPYEGVVRFVPKLTHNTT